jgi:hypothetical protein
VLGRVIAQSTRLRETVREMEEGPSGSAITPGWTG